MPKNESTLDRTLRAILGTTLILLALLLNLTTTPTIILAAAGLILLTTAAIGYCPLYTLLKINTCKTSNQKTQ